ncbi:hypothetical protein [Halosimplex pelagicum]|uniref:Uncharacterized protein n=1 Tax=Halosimplex pelagicum TaxID=869886 RepID=A0A7D5P6B1_9EURY|nr:hypothetical protein [Halosimplex pelagicum]QLH81917.1 hypothetical protein HZS54_09890 [Halosimplex pelagicum]
MRLANVATAPLSGLLVVVALAPAVPVAATLLAGALVATAVTFRADTHRYGVVGALYLLGVGAAVLALARFPFAWKRTPLFALWGFGLVSLGIFCLRVALGVVGRRVLALVVDDGADSVWDAISAFGGTLVIAWSVLTAHEKAARSAGVAAGVSTTTALDALGYGFPVLAGFFRRYRAFAVAGHEVVVPLWALRHGVDATTVLFVGCLIVGFHTVGTLAATWRAVRDTTGYAAEQTGDIAADATPDGGDADAGGDRAER